MSGNRSEHPENGASLRDTPLSTRFDELIRAHEQLSEQSGSFSPLTDAEDRSALVERIQEYLASVDIDSRIAGIRVLSLLRDEFEASALLAIWDDDDNRLAIADERLFECPSGTVLTDLIVSLDDEAYFCQPLMIKESFDTLLRELARSSRPDVPLASMNLLHGVLMQDFRDYAESTYGFMPAEFRIFWRSPFKAFNIRGAFGLAIATPQWMHELRLARFFISPP